MCLTVKDKTDELCLGAVSTAFFYACFWRYTSFGGAFPDQVGVSLMIALVFLIYREEKKAKRNAWAYALLSVVLFYIKQYFLAVALGILVYLLVRKEWRSFIEFSICGVIIGGTSIVIINKVFPLYFMEILPIAQGQTPAAGIIYSLKQLVSLIRSPFLIYTMAIVVAVIWNVVDRYVKKKKACSEVGMPIELAELIVMLPSSIYISRNDGTYYTYYLQLLFPFYIIIGATSLSLVIRSVHERDVLNKYAKVTALVVCALLFVKAFSYLSNFTLRDKVDKQMVDKWQNTYTFVDEKFRVGDVIVPACLGLSAINNNAYSHDYGQAEFNSQYNYDNWNDSVLWKNLFPDTGEVLKKNIEFDTYVLEGARNQRWSCIVVMPDSQLNENLLDLGYQIDHEEILKTGEQEWTLVFWVPEFAEALSKSQ